MTVPEDHSGRAPHDRPNILLIVSDDHGYGDISCRTPGTDVSTPGLDELIRSGMFFENGYVSAPICSPSRAGLITGRYQQRWGAHWFDDCRFAPPNVPTMPQVLKQAGYRTGYFGKVHYGPDTPGSYSCPEEHGFDSSFYGLAAQSMGRLHYLHHSRESLEAYGEAAGVHGVAPMLADGVEEDCEEHLTEEFSRRAIDFMDADDEPFFCMVAFNAVHNFAWQLPPEELDARGLPQHPDFDAEVNDYLDWYDGAISPNLANGRAYYAAQLEIMDRQIARMLENLERTGRRSSTLVVYLTDNGGSTCNYGDNTPLTGTKYTLFEGGVRVPFVVSWPGVVEADSTSEALVSALDLLPTFAAAASAPETSWHGADGIDLGPVLRQQESTAHEELHFDTGFQWSVRTAQWKLRWVDPDSPIRDHLRAVEHTDIGAGTTLVPIGSGPDESAVADVAATRPELVRELTARHERWREQVSVSQ